MQFNDVCGIESPGVKADVIQISFIVTRRCIDGTKAKRIGRVDIPAGE